MRDSVPFTRSCHIVDFKFDALYTGILHREPPEFGLVEKLSRSLYWWVELCVPFLHRVWYCTLR